LRTTHGCGWKGRAENAGTEAGCYGRKGDRSVQEV
jgi:hypothetical protein